MLHTISIHLFYFNDVNWRDFIMITKTLICLKVCMHNVVCTWFVFSPCNTYLISCFIILTFPVFCFLYILFFSSVLFLYPRAWIVSAKQINNNYKLVMQKIIFFRNIYLILNSNRFFCKNTFACTIQIRAYTIWFSSSSILFSFFKMILE